MNAGGHELDARRDTRATEVSQLLYREATVAKWYFPQENATFLNSNKGTFTVEPL
jgi:hypothetical protein